MKLQATMMSVAGREEITSRTARLLLEDGRLGELCEPVLHYVAPDGRDGPSAPGWRVARRQLAPADENIRARFIAGCGGSNPLEDFRAICLSLEPGVPWLFYEDDLASTKNACLRQAELLEHDLPADNGVTSCFDYRNEWPSPGIHHAPVDHDLWGAQALMFPGHVVTKLQERLRTPPATVEGWDTWIGRTVKELGLRVLHYSPSLFQHVGIKSVFAPGEKRPTALNYPGDDFDALGPCPDPVELGDCAFVPRPVRCALHREVHYDGFVCPQPTA